MSEDKLKSCPFCGGEAYFREALSFCTIQCGKCYSCIRYEESKEEAIAMWNRRVLEEAIRTLLEQIGSLHDI